MKNTIVTVLLLIAFAFSPMVLHAQDVEKNPILYGMTLSAGGKPMRFLMKADPDIAFKGFDVTVQPITYSDFPDYKSLKKAFEPGTGTVLFGSDVIGGNEVMATHSGYHDQKPLKPGEPFRTFLEGGYTTDRKTMILYDGDTRQRKLVQLIGKTMVVTQGDYSVTLKLDAIANVPPQSVNDFSSDLQTILGVVLTQTQGDVNAQFQKALTDPQQHLLMFFCGWGPDLSNPNWPTWSRYVLDFTIVPPDA